MINSPESWRNYVHLFSGRLDVPATAVHAECVEECGYDYLLDASEPSGFEII